MWNACDDRETERSGAGRGGGTDVSQPLTGPKLVVGVPPFSDSPHVAAAVGRGALGLPCPASALQARPLSVEMPFQGCGPTPTTVQQASMHQFVRISHHHHSPSSPGSVFCPLRAYCSSTSLSHCTLTAGRLHLHTLVPVPPTSAALHSRASCRPHVLPTSTCPPIHPVMADHSLWLRRGTLSVRRHRVTHSAVLGVLHEGHERVQEIFHS